MTDHHTSEVTIAVLPVLNGWRAAVYIDGKLAQFGPTSHDRDVAMLYAKHIESVARGLGEEQKR